MISSRFHGRDSLLFVYGTLRPFVDVPMTLWLKTVAAYAGPAKARGRLYDLGPYPGLRPALRSGDWVTGDVYRVSAKVLLVLDRYEAGAGGGAPRFVRRRCELATPKARSVRAWIYAYQRVVGPRARIASGDYRAALSSRSHIGDPKTQVAANSL
jgi:gamma-glutamylcyclotransferase (GGCT)/AIG2-like uncharacterized protein YtfP